MELFGARPFLQAEFMQRDPALLVRYGNHFARDFTAIHTSVLYSNSHLGDLCVIACHEGLLDDPQCVLAEHLAERKQRVAVDTYYTS